MDSWCLYCAKQGLGVFKSAWDKLNAELYQQHSYFDSRFIETMLQYFAHDTVWLCVHQSGGEIDGMLLVQRKGVTKWTLFLPAQAQVTPLLLQNPAILSQLLPLLPGFTLGLDLPCQDPAYSPLNPDSSSLQATIMPHALTINVNVSAGSFNDYLQRRSKKSDKICSGVLRRYSRRGLASHYTVLPKRPRWNAHWRNLAGWNPEAGKKK